MASLSQMEANWYDVREDEPVCGCWNGDCTFCNVTGSDGVECCTMCYTDFDAQMAHVVQIANNAQIWVCRCRTCDFVQVMFDNITDMLLGY